MPIERIVEVRQCGDEIETKHVFMRNRPINLSLAQRPHRLVALLPAVRDVPVRSQLVSHTPGGL